MKANESKGEQPCFFAFSSLQLCSASFPPGELFGDEIF
jgi:hypothetical protein